jgi:hypothetical protein
MQVRARKGEERPMKKYLIAVTVLIALAAPAGAQVQQQKMTECNAQAKGMTGDARKTFMSFMPQRNCFRNQRTALH